MAFPPMLPSVCDGSGGETAVNQRLWEIGPLTGHPLASSAISST